MELPVLKTDDPWYADGLTFTCTQCGNCCTGPRGYVHATEVEIARLAEFLKLTPEQVVVRYCRHTSGGLSFKEKRGAGGWDCIFLAETPARRRPAGADHDITYMKRTCTIYPVRPLQCRTWPFWEGNLWDRDAWNTAAKRCPGMNAGQRHFTREQIESLRDAPDWPENPPTSAP